MAASGPRRILPDVRLMTIPGKILTNRFTYLIREPSHDEDHRAAVPTIHHLDVSQGRIRQVRPRGS